MDLTALKNIYLLKKLARVKAKLQMMLTDVVAVVIVVEISDF